MDHSKFRGTGVALITPFKKDLSVDHVALEKLLDFNIENGINYFVSLGTTGESATLSAAEKIEVWNFTASIVKKRVPLVAGIGGNNTGEISAQIESIDASLFDAILSVSPYYNKPSQEGIYRHYMQLAARSPLPIILYNVPGRTASNITAETTLRLAAASQKIIGIKEASGNLAQMMQIIKNKPKDFSVISGDDLITLPGISFGMDGVISVVAQAFPKDFSAMVSEALDGNFRPAQKLHYKLFPFMELFFEEGSPPGVKAALNILGLCEETVRLPLTEVSRALYEKIKAAIANDY
ncbi:MAG: 4-hydroxy-tetrahydrodipicolinate synthase [Chitinophagales bacterium]|nr:4-hydroxy-tetrahydrodipicolinate synthase [Chitinophagales bacterium]